MFVYLNGERLFSDDQIKFKVKMRELSADLKLIKNSFNLYLKDKVNFQIKLKY